MKLLDKRTIAQQKSVERKMEIDEGLKLVHKVSVLRETSAKEQANLVKFRDETLAQIRKDISKLNEEKETVSKKVEVLKLERAELKKPLDKEWKKVQEESVRLNEIGGELEQKRFALLQIEEDLDEKSKELKLEEDRIEERKLKVNASIQDSEELKRKAKEALSEAEKIKSVSQETARSQKEELFKEWAKVETEKRDIKNFQLVLEKKEVALSRKDKSIKDRYETLLRTQQRLKNG